MNYAGSRINGGGQVAVTEVRVETYPFDPVQITHPANKTRFAPGPSPSLTGDPRTPTVIGFYTTGGSHGVSALNDASPALKVGSSAGIPSPPGVAKFAPQWDRTGAAEALCANEQRTYTNEGSIFRLRNVVGDVPAYAFKPSHYTRDKDGAPSEVHPPLSADADKGDQDPVVYAVNFEHGLAPHGSMEPKGTVDQLTATEHKGKTAVFDGEEHVTVMAPRRLTPTECARLQGFPDEWLDIEGASDSAKYRALGNAVAVPVVEWIAKRIVAANGS